MPGGLLGASNPRRRPQLAQLALGGGWRSLSGAQAVVRDNGSLRAARRPKVAHDEDVDRLLKRGEAAVYKEILNPPRCRSADDQAELVLVDSARGLVVGLERPLPQSVVLNVYDLSKDVSCANNLLAFSSERLALGGFFHAGVEVFGSEWSFGCLGVSSALPRTRDTAHVYRCSVDLGSLALGRARFAAVVWAMCQEWRGHSYELLGHNCCSFASELCRRLGVGEMPGWVDRFARLLRPDQQAHALVSQAGERVVSAGQEMLLGLEVAYRRLIGTAAIEEARAPPGKASDGAAEGEEAPEAFADSVDGTSFQQIRYLPEKYVTVARSLEPIRTGQSEMAASPATASATCVTVARSPEPVRTGQSETAASPATVSATPPTPAPRRYLVAAGLRTPPAPARAAPADPGASAACASTGGGRALGTSPAADPDAGDQKAAGHGGQRHHGAHGAAGSIAVTAL